MLKKILIGCAILLLAFAALVAIQPSEYRVVRMATMSAPPKLLFDQVNDFHNWDAWSPWAKLDPNVKNTFSGPASGVGSVFAWSGNSKVGEGRMTLTESRPGELVKINLEFIKPFASVCTTEFAFQPEGTQTAVTWSMSGQNNFMAKAVCLFMNMDKTVGGDFEKGLAQMKALVEAAGKPRPDGGK